jgi:hypothetical protein
MEVHHHAHAPKKLREYLTEFFMLFLAVTLGFLAENIREHYIEQERAHELLESFMHDVSQNIILMDSLTTSNSKMIMKNDSAVLYLLENDLVDLDSFYNLLPVTSYRYLNNNETYDQMKSSGSLRYIKDTTLLRKIIAYNNASKAAEFRSITQEFEYTAHEYTEAIQKWMPGEIATKRHASLFLTRPLFKRMMKTKNDTALINKLNNYGDHKTYYISGEELKQMRKELIPAISRKTFLMSASVTYMYMTDDLAEQLIEYYQKEKSHIN